MSSYLINVFQDTQKCIWEKPMLYQMTTQSSLCTQVFPERFETTRVVGSYSTGISVTPETTFQAARRLKDKYVKIGVLNFANAVNPGGSVLNGAQAQEEDLCRCSNLYSTLIKPEIYDSFYAYNNGRSPYYSDRIIHSPNVTVFKTEAPDYAYTEDWFQVDVFTCPAPNLNGMTIADFQMLEKIYESRIRNILSVAEAHGIQALVLGAFGCGAFLNPPELMAKAFYQELFYGDFRDAFREIVFAIKADSPQGAYNLKTFQEVLCPWQENPLFGKKVSILGDSISTYPGYNPEGYPVFYTAEQAVKTGLYAVTDTWWMQLINSMQARLLVNNSCFGSCVSRNSTLSAHNDNRLFRLCSENELPDVVLVEMGMNDYEYGIPLEPAEGETVEWNTYYRYFRPSYQMMLWKLKQYFPMADIYCATISYGAFGGNTNHLFAEGQHGIPLSEYNRVIKECAQEYGCRVVDIAKEIKHYESVDGVHPTAAGMCKLAETWEAAIDSKENTFYVRAEQKKRNWLVAGLSVLLGVLVIFIIILLLQII